MGDAAAGEDGPLYHCRDARTNGGALWTWEGDYTGGELGEPLGRGRKTFHSGPRAGDFVDGEAHGVEMMREATYTRADGVVFSNVLAVGADGNLVPAARMWMRLFRRRQDPDAPIEPTTITTTEGDVFVMSTEDAVKGALVDVRRSSYARRSALKSALLLGSGVLSALDFWSDANVANELYNGGDDSKGTVVWGIVSFFILFFSMMMASTISYAVRRESMITTLLQVVGLAPLAEAVAIVVFRRPFIRGTRITRVSSPVGEERLTAMKAQEALTEALPQLLLQVYIAALQGITPALALSLPLSLAGAALGLVVADKAGMEASGTARAKRMPQLAEGDADRPAPLPAWAAGPWAHPLVLSALYRSFELAVSVGGPVIIALAFTGWAAGAILAAAYLVIVVVAASDTGSAGSIIAEGEGGAAPAMGPCAKRAFKGLLLVAALMLGIPFYAPYLFALHITKWHRGEGDSRFLRDPTTVSRAALAVHCLVDLVAVAATLRLLVDPPTGPAFTLEGKAWLVALLLVGLAVKHALCWPYYTRLSLEVDAAHARLGVVRLAAAAAAAPEGIHDAAAVEAAVHDGAARGEDEEDGGYEDEGEGDYEGESEHGDGDVDVHVDGGASGADVEVAVRR